MMKKILLILICLFVSFEVKSDILEDLNKSKNVSRLEYSLDKLIPELELEVYGFRDSIEEFDENRSSKYRFSQKKCYARISKLDWTGHKSDKEMIVLRCNLTIKMKTMNRGQKISKQRQVKNFNGLLDDGMEIFADKIARKIFEVLGKNGEKFYFFIFLRKFDNKYNTEKLLRENKVTEIHEDFVNLLKERIMIHASINVSDVSRTVSENFYYPFSQKLELDSMRIPRFEKIRIKTYDSKKD